ncbi:RNA 2'-phosphotransferase, partial [Lacticaseibacillus rhamnosus]
TAGALFFPPGSRGWVTGKIFPKILTRMPPSG